MSTYDIIICTIKYNKLPYNKCIKQLVIFNYCTMMK